MDPSINPGFHYRVRVLGRSTNSTYLFGGRALLLKSVGIGYGKRITFASEKLNENRNYFYSDTNEDGYGFELVTITEGDVFTVFSKELGRSIGQAHVNSVLNERECDRTVTCEGTVQKHVTYEVIISLRYAGDVHGLLCLLSDEEVSMSLMAVVEKPKGSKVATMKQLCDIKHHVFGSCMLLP